MKRTLFFLVTLLTMALAFHAIAQIPRTLSYQGVLTDVAGKPRPDGSYSFTFRLYTSPTNGTAIWSESKSLSVKSGLFSTELGKETPFSAAVKFETQYWLGIQVGNDPELSPRIALTSVGYSFSSLRADTARVSVASLADTTWRHNGANIYRRDGSVGIGTMNPSERLSVAGDLEFKSPDGQFDHVAALKTSVEENGSANLGIWTRQVGDQYERLTVTYDGKVGIGTTSPSERLSIAGDLEFKSPDGQFNRVAALKTSVEANGSANLGIWTRQIGDQYERLTVTYDGKVGIGTTSPSERLSIAGDLEFKSPDGQFNHAAALKTSVEPDGSTNLGIWTRHVGDQYERLTITHDGNVGIGTTIPSTRLHVEGVTTTKVLAITGGGDLAEPFEISENQPIPKGALVIIDEENPGRLKLSHYPYDKRVAGVVSGAGGINPGLTLMQEGVLEGGQNVALSGRVYALATAANGSIKPGDLLTTSDVPGHAMKATDFVRWQGAVIGKAMSSLEKGEGLVLVLVNLQ